MSRTETEVLRERIRTALEQDEPVSCCVEELGRCFVLLASQNEFGLDLLCDLTCLEPEPGELVVRYQLSSSWTDHRLVLHVSIDGERPSVPSATEYWPPAEVLEREVADLFGVVFEDHPDPRRLFLDDFADYFPLRKDFELEEPEPLAQLRSEREAAE